MSSTSVSSTSPPGPPDSTYGPLLGVEGISSGYFGSRIIDGISFNIDKPGIYVVLGPNGAGKTTLFRTLAGILKPYSGSITINGSPGQSKAAREQVDYMSHIDGIPDGMRVAEALQFYANVEGAGSQDVDRCIRMLGLESLERSYFSQLSRGQKKRVSIARIFLREKKVYLLDEPTANLDPKVARETRELVLGLARDKVVLYSSHNLYEAREIGSEVLVVSKGKLTMFGRIDNIKTEKCVVGVRTLTAETPKILSQYGREGDYYLVEVSGPEQVPKLVSELVSNGVQIREVREMQNPLEELFQ